MVKHCEMFEHTADIGLRARGETLAELLEALAEALAEFLCPRDRAGARETRAVRIEAEDVEALTVDFLSAVLDIIQVDRRMIAAVRVGEADEHSASAEVACEPFDPARHPLRTEVKAVTYHLLKVRRDGAGWTGQVLLDL